MSDARQTYVDNLAARRQQHTVARSKADRISTARLGTAAAMIAVVVAASEGWLHPLWIVAPAVSFVGLVILHDRVLRTATLAERAAGYYEAGLRRLDGAWQGHGVQRTDHVAPDHPYARDLDLFGRASLFELLCTTRTQIGEHTLARWLSAPAPVAVVRARQAAVRNLRNRVALREDLALAGETMQTQVEPAELIAWGHTASALDEQQMRRIQVLAALVPAANLLAGLGWMLGLWSGWPLLATLLVTWLVHRRHEPYVSRVEAGVRKSSRELTLVASVLRRLERESFQDPLLKSLHAELASGRTSASRQIERLSRLVQWLEVRHGQFVSLLVGAFLWGIHFAFAIERWRVQRGRDIERWFSALGELEALCAVSAYAYERPADPFPELVDEGRPLVVGEALGHPLLPVDRCVRNDVRLGADLQALVISGSNMSGKSTYLRTVGLNVVLALAGAPVRAKSLRLSFLHVGASLQIVDSLSEGASRFYAEVRRLRQISDLTGGPLLFLLDEILHGTNSHDRRIGAFAVLRSFVEAGAIGLVTTHDLALAADTEALGSRVDNVHFSDDVVQGKLHFDYTLRPGVVQSSNALELMRAVGLPV